MSELASASAAARIDGTATLHFDVRSDNLCIQDGRAILVDWNHACVGNPLLETAAWLPSLRAEGGPAEEEVPPPDTEGLPEVASLLAGYQRGVPACRRSCRRRTSARCSANKPRRRSRGRRGRSDPRRSEPANVGPLHLQHAATIGSVDPSYDDLMLELRSRGRG